MALRATQRIPACPKCGLPLPLRFCKPGEVGATWTCRCCSVRFYGALDDDSPANIIANVEPAKDLNPRIVLNGKTLAQLFKRADQPARVRNQRQSDRIESALAVHLQFAHYSISTQTRDLSAGGFSALVHSPSGPGEEVLIQFEALPDQPAGRGVVRHCSESTDGGYLIGIAFIE